MNAPPNDKQKTLYQTVADSVLGAIERGEFSYDQPICTENKLMEQYSVSRITARRAMSELEGQGILYRKRGVGSFVSRDIYQRTQKTSGNSKLFAFIFPFDVSKSGLSAAFRAANSALLRQGYAASIYITEDDEKKRGRDSLKQLVDADIAGVAYYPKTANVHLDLLNRLAFTGKPVVLIDVPSPTRYISSVSSANYEGSIRLMQHLIELRHRRIAYISGIPAESRKTVADRMDGYVLGLCRAGLTPDADLIITTLTEEFRRSPGTENRPTQLHETVHALLGRGVTAVLCEHDQMAFEFTIACRSMGVRVPEDISVCGFDHSEWAHMLPEGITTIEQDMTAVGAKVAELLVSGINALPALSEQIVIPTHLILGGTTCAAPHNKRTAEEETI